MREQYNTANREFAAQSISTDRAAAGTPSVALARQNIISTTRPHDAQATIYEISKRGLDVSCAACLILILSPLFVLIAVIVKLTSSGPVFFRHRRLGLGGNGFYCLKFRTMVSNAEQLLTTDPQMKRLFDQKFKIDDDPRVTRLGKFLRCTSLDELPQLFHVIQGKMSLIGPRPIIEREREKYAIYVGKLLSVRPGLSGLWQVAGRSDTTYADRVLLDMYYIDNRGFVLDLKIFLKTFSAVIKRAGAR
jgi:lipopolysaccharide/colanic/teichoic acid biosynthesis glycosyltransferase